ncbi:MAG: glycosyltransferase family 2 protein [Thermoflexales bacterium]|nr:glycosyltransferase family 2 protein [Thermoflexales bacterium]
MPEQTLISLAALKRSRVLPEAILVVDNGSSEDNLARLKSLCSPTAVLALDRNLGFAGGMNHGLEAMSSLGLDYALLLNNDVEVAPGMLQELIEVARLDPQVAIVAPVMKFASQPNEIWHSGTRFGVITGLPKAISPDAKATVRSVDVDAVPAAVWLVSLKAFRKIGGFDRSYFMYYEDWDLCTRMKKCGYEIKVATQAVAWHAVSASTRNQSGFRHAHFAYGRIRFYLSRGRIISRLICFVAILTSEALELVKLTLHGRYNVAYARIGGFCRGIVSVFRNRATGADASLPRMP